MRDDSSASSAERTLAVLDLLAARGRPMPSMAIARECAIPRSTLYRVLNVMRDREYLTSDRASRTWGPGPRLSRAAAAGPVVARMLAVLEVFDSRTPRLSIGEIAARAHMDPEAAADLVGVLVAEGLLASDQAGRVGLGLRVVGLAARVEPIEQLLRAARPHLERLRDRTGETANLLVRDGSSGLYLDQVESPRALRVSGWIGRRIPLAGSASGAALTGPGVHAVADAVEPGVIAVACGISGIAGMSAAVSVTAPAARLRGSLLAHAEAEVGDVASAISTALAAAAQVSSTASPAHTRPHTGEGGTANAMIEEGGERNTTDGIRGAAGRGT